MPTVNEAILKDRRVRAFVVDRKTGSPRARVVVRVVSEPGPGAAGAPVVRGVYQSDQVGYLAFNLRVDPKQPRDLWLRVAGDETVAVKLDTSDTFDAKKPVVLEVPSDHAGAGSKFLPSIVEPDAVDRDVSPLSFASADQLVIGADDCQRFLQSAVSERVFRASKLTFAEGAAGILVPPPPAPTIKKPGVVVGAIPSWLREFLGNTGDESVALPYRFGQLFEYRLEWQPLGHALGEIVYSLPLAPCETVKLAVVEWSRRDEASRGEDTTVREELLHEQRRDRVIEETVNAAVREWQQGGSVMAGISLWGAVNIGGSYSLSEGTRDTHGEDVQRLSDSVMQASTAVRNLYSTVVVQASQAERDVVETRAVSNHNHCHAMTVLYYEVVRHYRVLSIFDAPRSRDVLFVKLPIPPFTRASALGYRAFLEPALLEARLAAAFEAGQRAEYSVYDPPTTTTPATQPTNKRRVTQVTVDMRLGASAKTGGSNAEFVIERRGQPTLVEEVSSGAETLQPLTVARHEFGTSTRELFLEDIVRVGIRSNLAGGFGAQVWSWHLDGVDVWCQLEDGSRVELFETRGLNYLLSREPPNYNSWSSPEITVPAATAAPVAPSPTAPADPRDRDVAAANYLLAHLNMHNAYYWRVIWASQDVGEYALLLDGMEIDFNGRRSRVLDIIDLRVIGVVGDYVAFPTKPRNDSVLRQVTEASTEAVTFVSLPTRGVFAEVKLSDCNACEERDDTRFWNWQESPCPDEAPAITNVSPGSRAQAPQDLTPSQMPSPLVNIVSPAPAPDPTGLTAAMSLLGTANLFRDMSGRADVALLLRQLAQGQLTAQQAQTAAQAIQASMASSGAAATAPTSGGSGRTAPTAREQHDQLNILRNAEQHGDITPEQRQALSGTYLSDAIADQLQTVSYSEERHCVTLRYHASWEDFRDDFLGARGTGRTSEGDLGLRNYVVSRTDPDFPRQLVEDHSNLRSQYELLGNTGMVDGQRIRLCYAIVRDGERGGVATRIQVDPMMSVETFEDEPVEVSPGTPAILANDQIREAISAGMNALLNRPERPPGGVMGDDRERVAAWFEALDAYVRTFDLILNMDILAHDLTVTSEQLTPLGLSDRVIRPEFRRGMDDAIRIWNDATYDQRRAARLPPHDENPPTPTNRHDLLELLIERLLAEDRRVNSGGVPARPIGDWDVRLRDIQADRRRLRRLDVDRTLSPLLPPNSI